VSQENKALIKHFVEESFNRGNLNVVDEVYASSFVSHDPATPQEERSPEDAKQFVDTYRSAFPDGRAVIEDLIAEALDRRPRRRLRAAARNGRGLRPLRAAAGAGGRPGRHGARGLQPGGPDQPRLGGP
jgi:predicted SnoaL-like aldol condensation-catalyzing enzyme